MPPTDAMVFVNTSGDCIPAWWRDTVAPEVKTEAERLCKTQTTLTVAALTCDDLEGELDHHQCTLRLPLPDASPGITLFLR
eukprot:3932726-Rhodomonas_salina.2